MKTGDDRGNSPSKVSQKNYSTSFKQKRKAGGESFNARKISPQEAPRTGKKTAEKRPDANEIKKIDSETNTELEGSSFTSFFHNPFSEPKKSIMMHPTQFDDPKMERESCFVKALKHPCLCCCCPWCTLKKWCIVIGILLIVFGLLKLIEFHDMPDRNNCIKRNTVSVGLTDEASKKCEMLENGMIATISLFTIASIVAGIFLLVAVFFKQKFAAIVCIVTLAVAVLLFIIANSILYELALHRKLGYYTGKDRQTALGLEHAYMIIQILALVFLYLYFAICAWALREEIKEELNKPVGYQNQRNKLYHAKAVKKKKAFFSNRRGRRSLFGNAPPIPEKSKGTPRASIAQRQSVLRRSSSELAKYESIRRDSKVSATTLRQK